MSQVMQLKQMHGIVYGSPELSDPRTIEVMKQDTKPLQLPIQYCECPERLFRGLEFRSPVDYVREPITYSQITIESIQKLRR